MSSATRPRGSPAAGVKAGGASRERQRRRDLDERAGSGAATARHGRAARGQRDAQPARVGEGGEEQASQYAVAAPRVRLLLDRVARRLDQHVVRDARGAGRDAGHAAEAAVEVLDDRPVERDRAVQSRLHQLDSAARRVHLLAPEHVRRAGRQAEAAVDAVVDVLADHAGAALQDAVRVEGARAPRSRSRRNGSGARRRDSCGDVGDARSGADDRLVQSARAWRRGRPGRSASRPRAARLARARLLPDVRSVPRRRRRARARRRAAPRPPPRCPRRGRPRGRDGGRRARSAAAASAGGRRSTPAVSSVSTTSVRVAGGQRVEPERDPSDQRQRPGRAADELAEVVAGDVLDDLAAGARDRPVGEHERDAEDEVARRAEAVPAADRRGSAARQAPIGRVAGRVEREPLAVLGERRLERGEPDARPRPCTSGRPASCSRMRSSPSVVRSSPIRTRRPSASARREQGRQPPRG